MPWLAFPFDHDKLTLFTRLYNVNGIPAFLILDEENNIITRHGRNAMLSDPSGKLFPWGPQPMYELNEYTLCRLRDEPSLVLFTAICLLEPQKPDVSAEIVAEFVAEYKSGKVHMTPLPSSCQVSSPTNSLSAIFFSLIPNAPIVRATEVC
uniref:Thioredoxin-like fold domain-containing protein n=1 Tax=Parascaris equorum TaxID=6256 RepID=A0A914RKL1_PAREQ